ncbi:MAG TPA: tRNA (N(6)-L-threonylcarbamoyladenosine(37)-C(2))-methylthiotransferase MtaB [Dehalococcoidia bacterium]|nr:tRNA (N(6)-L-threonylcarbamoyladenosine(37)-C(2))-methylthiotransferase MtaB [Dehalococcoidia bacterium]
MAAPAKSLRNVAVLTLGCKLNHADSDALARRFAEAGCAVSEDPRNADAVVINSCTVTHVADAKARQLVRRARRLSPAATIVLTGCYVDSAGQRLSLDEADLIIGNEGKPRVVDMVFRARTGQPPAAEAAGERPGLARLRTRAFVKIQEGCNDVCAFCIVPRVRGPENSRTIADVVLEARQHEAAGVQELVLTGTQLGHYGRDKGWEPGPLKLLQALLRNTAVPRIRVSSLQAQDFSEQLLELWQDPRLCPHFHVPLQSGSEHVLGRMRRRYDPKTYRSAIAMIRRTVPGAALTTDVIAGFPGETDDDFEQTLQLCRDMRFAAIHAFPYSIRRGTAAALMADQVEQDIRDARVNRLIALGRESGRRFRETLVGTHQQVLWEESRENTWIGLTPNYCRVRAVGRGAVNTIDNVRIDGVAGALLTGVIEPRGRALGLAS